MKLHFLWAEVLKALEEINTAKTARQLYGKDVGPGLFLVGDQGIYLIPNTTDGVHHQTGTHVVVYAQECDPRQMEFDKWWETKNRVWGGDDGVEFIDIEGLKRLADTPLPSPMIISHLAITIDGEQLKISVEFAPKH